MQQQDLQVLYYFLLSQISCFIEFCQDRGLSECEAERIVDELEESLNGN
ncbi:hypothetical protein PT273_09070 [Orbaceae bacterium ESL0727]|nr:hypothetical protein [Orbaceae bacterium ESL0727]MDF7667990.1 hypothetical protein [Orbaceae bacterium ESL0727]